MFTLTYNLVDNPNQFHDKLGDIGVDYAMTYDNTNMYIKIPGVTERNTVVNGSNVKTYYYNRSVLDVDSIKETIETAISGYSPEATTVSLTDDQKVTALLANKILDKTVTIASMQDTILTQALS